MIARMRSWITQLSAVAKRTAVTVARRRRAQLFAMLAAGVVIGASLVSVLGVSTDHRDATDAHRDHGGYGRPVDGDGR